MKIIFILLFVFQCSFSYCQHSERFLNLVKDIKPSDSLSYVDNYSNGSLKISGTLLYYDRPEYKYSKKSKLWNEYYRNGKVKAKSEYDGLGNLLSKILYDINGLISSEIVAISIDSKISNPVNYFLQNHEVVVLYEIKNYIFSEKFGKAYLRETGVTEGGKRVGLWKIYTQTGKLEKEINYSK